MTANEFQRSAVVTCPGYSPGHDDQDLQQPRQTEGLASTVQPPRQHHLHLALSGHCTSVASCSSSVGLERQSACQRAHRAWRALKLKLNSIVICGCCGCPVGLPSGACTVIAGSGLPCTPGVLLLQVPLVTRCMRRGPWPDAARCGHLQALGDLLPERRH